jgi:hypothetical protein
VVSDGEPREITKALATAQDIERCVQEEGSGRDANATPHPINRDVAQETDQITIGCGSSVFEHREESIPPKEPQADDSG